MVTSFNSVDTVYKPEIKRVQKLFNQQLPSFIKRTRFGFSETGFFVRICLIADGLKSKSEQIFLDEIRADPENDEFTITILAAEPCVHRFRQ